MVFDFGIKLSCGEGVIDYIVFEFGYIDVICGEFIYGFVECGWNVVYLKDKVGYYVMWCFVVFYLCFG